MSQSAPKYFETDGTATANWYRLANGTRKYAKNLHEALASAIELHCGGKWGRSEVEAAGRRDYEAAFGHPISSRHLWRLIEMIIDRTGDRRQFDDLSLYLPPRLVRKPSKAVFDRLADELPALASHVLLVNDPKAPTANERLLLWDSACRECQRLIDAGVSKRKAVRAVVVALDASGIALAYSREALRRSFGRKHARWVKGGCKPGAISDLRPERSGWRRPLPLTEEDISRLTLSGVRIGLARAIRDARRDGLLSAEACAAYTSDPSWKSYVPRRIRDLVGQRIHLVKDIDLGPHNAELKGAYISRNYRGTEDHTGDLFQSDDCTVDVYFWLRDAIGQIRVIRGQFLPIIDERTTRILAFALRAAGNYTAAMIRTLIIRAHDKFGLPRKGFYFERGMWENAKLLKGVRDPAPWQDSETGLTEWCTFQHARGPRAKIVERVLRSIQTEVGLVPGFCGSDEIHKRYERNEANKRLVETGKMHPSEAFLSFEEWDKELTRICGLYNDERQDRHSRRIPGRSPREAFDEWLDPSPGRKLMRLEAEHRFLLANHRKPCRVVRNGIWATLEGQKHWFRSEQLGEFVNREVQMYYDPEDLSSCWCLLDRTDTKAIVVPHEPDCPLGASPEQLRAGRSSVAAMNRAAKTLYTVIQPPSQEVSDARFRPVFAAPATLAMGQEIAAEQAEIRDRQEETATARRQLARYQRQFGVTPNQESISDSRLLDGYRLIEEAKRNAQHTPSES